MPLEIKGISHIYNKGLPQEQKALTDISFTIADNDFVAVIGHTGSGKSTLMQIMNGLIKPATGTVLLNGQDINGSELKINIVRQKVGLVFQYPEHQLFEETVYKDVAFGPRNLQLGEEEVKRRVLHALDLVGLSEETFLHVSPFSLSGGEKRRAAIAGVLAMEPQFLILDEPTAGLDPRGRDDIMGAVIRLQKATGITVILVTHSMDEVAKYAHAVHVLHQGKCILSGTPQAVFAQHEILQSTGLSLPAAADIILKLRSQGVTLADAITVPDAAQAITLAWRDKNVL